MEPVHIQMLGTFTLQFGDRIISDNQNRSRKVWLLLAYLICRRGTAISPRKLIEQVWGDDPSSSNPENMLRITLHRLRSQLDQLWPGAGRELILNQSGGYCWNEAIPITLDTDRFEKASAGKGAPKEIRLAACLEALALYRGGFLEKLSSETWIIPIATHFHNLYVQLTLEAAALSSELSRHEEAIGLCRGCILREPYHEPLYQMLIQELSAAGDHKAAADVYAHLSRKLFNDFGIQPSAETTALYRQCVHHPEDRTLPMDEVLEHLTEAEAVPGAMQCDYDYFKILCHAESRAMERSGGTVHIALLSATAMTGDPLPQRNLERIMVQLGNRIRVNLRRGDVISRCSKTQYIIMLPGADYENSCMVCRRVIHAYHRAFPHTAVHIRFMVRPLSPGISVP